MRKFGLGFLVLAGVLAPQMAFSAGFGLREHSAEALGAANAGASASTSDASYIAFNPAALGFVDSADFSVTLAGILPSSEANYSAITSALTPVSGPGSPDDFIDNAALPAIAARWRLDDRWAVGVSVTGPWGLSTAYPNDWVGRYYARNTKLITVNIAPVVSFAITPHFVIAGGAQAQYAHGDFSNAVDVGTIGAGFLIPGSIPGAQDISARFSADGWGWGWTLGAIAELSDNVTLGVAYRSSIDTDADGTLKFNIANNTIAQIINGATGLFANTPASTSLTTPAMLNIGARLGLGNGWTLLGEANWTDWTSFDELRIRSKNPVQPDDVTLAHWDSSWFFSGGLEYQADEHWTLRAGGAFDESPIPDSTLGPRIPDGDRTWVTLGATYHTSDKVAVSVGASHLFVSDRDIHLSATEPANAFRGNLDGRSKASVNVIALQLSFSLN